MSKIVLSLGLVLLSVVVLAQGAPPTPPGVPIDGGLSLLLVAGGIYGVKKLNDKRKSL